MKQIYTSLLLAVFFPLCTVAQTYTQSAEGKSSLLYRGGNIMFNTTDPKISFGYNNLNKVYSDSNAFLIGFELQGKNNDGISDILSGEELNPEATAQFNLGVSFTNFPVTGIDLNLLDQLIDGRKKFIEEEYVLPVINFASLVIHNVDLKECITKVIKEENLYIPEYTSECKDEVKTKQDTVDLKDFLNYAERVKARVNPKVQDLTAKTEEARLPKKNIAPLSWTALYGRLGVTGQSFKYFEELNTENYNDSFRETLFTGIRYGIGLNHKRGNLMGGFYVDRVHTNSFAALSKKTFTLTEMDTSSNGQFLKQEKEITAFTGDYEKFNIWELRNDFLLTYSLNQKQYLGINPYWQLTFGSDEKDLLPNHIDAGIGFYFFKNDGSFLGGLYIEMPDLANEYEKLKDDPDLDPFVKRMRIGIVTTFTFNKILWN